MKRLIATALAVVLVSAIPVAARPGNQDPPKPQPSKPDAKAPAIAGKWATTLEFDAFTATVALEFKQDGAKITGTYTGRYGTFPFEVKVKGRTIEFGFKMPAESTTVEMFFTGDVAADDKTIKGRVTMSELGEGTWTAKREGS